MQNVSINHTFVASPTLLFNSTFGMNRQRGGSTSTAPFGFREAGANIIGPEDHPEIDSPPELIVSVTGGPSINTNHLGDFDRGDFTFRHVGTKIAGSHEFRFGGEAVNVRNHLINTFQMAGRVAFNGQLSGNGMADFMFGRTTEFRQGGGEFKDLKGTRWGFFIQDNWTASPRLTVNLGFRWDPYLSPWDREGRVICFDPDLQSVRYPNAPKGLLYGGDNADPGCPKAGVEPVWTNFGPRLGVAYRLTNDGKTMLRSGFGIFYTPERTGASNSPVEHGALRRHLYLERRGLGGSVREQGPGQSVSPTVRSGRARARGRVCAEQPTSPIGTPTAAFLRCTRTASVWSGSS